MAVVVPFLLELAAAYAVGRLINAFFGPKPKIFSPKFEDNQTSVRSAIEPHKVVYGEAITSGPIVFANTSGSKNEILHMVIPLAGHEVDSINDVYFDDVVSTDPFYFRKGIVDFTPIIRFGVGHLPNPFSDISGITLSLTINTKTFSHTPPAGTIGAVKLRNYAKIVTADLYTKITTDPGYAAENYVVAIINSGITLEITGKNPGDLFTYSTNRPDPGIFSGSFSDTGFFAQLSVIERATLFTLKKHLGSPSQLADNDLIAAFPAKWTTAHQLKGRAYLYSQLEYDQNRWPTGIPNFRALVKGKKVFDPRTGLTVWSDNPALCIRDYLTDANYGRGALAADINDTTFIAAANVCDELLFAKPATAIAQSSIGNPGSIKSVAHGLRIGDSVVIADHSSNLLLRSEEFDNAIWTKSNCTVTPNTGIAPDGTTTADTVTVTAPNVNSNLRQVSGTPKDGSIFTFSIWARQITGTAAFITLDLNDSLNTTIALTSSFQRFSASKVPGAPVANVFVDITFTQNGTYEVWGAQLENNATLSAYQKTVSVINASVPNINGTWTVTPVDDDNFTIPVNITTAGTGGTAQLQQKRYTCNGVINTGDIPIDIIGKLLTSCNGTLVFSEGKYDLKAAAYTAPVMTLTESDLRGAISFQTKPNRKDLFNGVKGTCINKFDHWQEMDFPAYTNATYEAQDGLQILRDLNLPFTNDPYRAQRLGKVFLERARQSIMVQFPAKMTVFKLKVNDVVQVSIAYLGWVNKQFIVASWEYVTGGGPDLILQEEASASYDWASGSATLIDPAPNTTLPSAFTVSPPGSPIVNEKLYTTTDGSGVKTRAVVSWAAPTDAFVSEYELQYQSTTTGLTVLVGRTKDRFINADDIAPDIYVFQVRAFNTLGFFSDYAIAEKEILGLTAPPSDITGFSINVLDKQAVLIWDKHADLDVLIGGTIRVRHSNKLTGATWSDGIDLAPALPGITTRLPIPLLSGTYMAKAVDSTGNESVNFTSLTTTIPSIVQMNVVTTSTQDPTFSGAKSNVVAIDNILKLEGQTLWDDMLTLIDTWVTIDALGGIKPAGSYTFDQAIDLGGVYTSRVTATIEALAYATDDTIDDRTALIDDWDLFDGGNITDAAAKIYVRTTNDDPAGAPVWSPWMQFFIGDYVARGFQFRLDLSSETLNHNINISKLRVTVDMPDRVETFGNQTIPAGGLSIVYSFPFKALPAIGATIKDMATGDFLSVTAESVNGATFQVKNAAGSGVARTGEIWAKGYGQKVA